jgi:hypothetical protein
MRDYQRRRVYDWEKTCMPIHDNVTLSLEDCTRLAWRISRYANVPRPGVADGRGRRRPGANYRGITLPRWSRNEYVLCHEMAHYINLNRGLSDDIHGPNFVAIYIDLLVQHCRRPRSVIHMELIDAKIDWRN